MDIYRKEIYENELFVGMYKEFVNAIETYRMTLGFTNEFDFVNPYINSTDDEAIDSYARGLDEHNDKVKEKYDLLRKGLLSRVHINRVLLSSSIIDQLELLAISIFEKVPVKGEGELDKMVSVSAKSFYDELDSILIDYLPY